MDDGLKAVMTVAGSDSGAGAGIQADIFTFASMGLYATSAIAALTAQNPCGVRSVYPASAQSLADQLAAVWEYYRPSAAKCGMLFNSELILTAADFFKNRPEIALVVDPVMISTSGAVLLPGVVLLLGALRLEQAAKVSRTSTITSITVVKHIYSNGTT